MLNNKLKIIKLSLRNYFQVMPSLAFCFKSGWNSLPKTPYFLSLFYSLFIVTLLSLLSLFQAQTKPKNKFCSLNYLPILSKDIIKEKEFKDDPVDKLIIP